MGQESELDLCVIKLPADDPAGTHLAGLACCSGGIDSLMIADGDKPAQAIWSGGT